MCGISGIINNENFPLIKKMVQAQIHRGPDNQSYVFFENIRSAFGHNRLSIIDINENANQPFYDLTKNFCLVFNGEIYNYQELKLILARKGYKFVTNSDTEVALYSYIEWGSSCVNYFRGMFALAIINTKNGETFLARDRFGIKPLVYAQFGKSLMFASEAKTILETEIIGKEINFEKCYDFLLNGSIHQPDTFYSNIFQLPPGSYAIFKNFKLSITFYWDIYDNTILKKNQNLSIKYNDAVRELRYELEEAAKYHLISDVQVGAFLSGGIDSTAVLGLMSKISQTSIKTFTINFQDEFKNLDELEYALIASDFFSSKNKNQALDYHEFHANITQIIRAMDQPSIDGANTYFASKLASKDVKVVLSGLGGDELFAGYPHFSILNKNRFFKNPRNSILFEYLDQINLKGSFSKYALKEFKLLFGSKIQNLSMIRNYLTESEALDLLRDYNYYKRFNKKSKYNSIQNYIRDDLDPIDQISYFEIKNYLTDTLLRDSDVMSMHFGIELRPMLLDHILSEYIFSLPSNFKFDGKTHKRIFIDAVRDLLPDKIIARRKSGFELPIWEWSKKVKTSNNNKTTWFHHILHEYCEKL